MSKLRLIIFVPFLLALVYFVLQSHQPPKPVEKIVVVPTPTPIISYVTHGNRNLHQIALTFDADMTPAMKKKLDTGVVKSWYNQKIIDVLRQKNVPATIFITGMWAEIYPQVTRDLASDPLFEVANHSYSHPGFTPTCFGLPGFERSRT